MAEIVALDDVSQNIKRLVELGVTGQVRIVAQQSKKSTVKAGLDAKAIEVVWSADGSIERIATTEGVTVAVFDLRLPEGVEWVEG